MTSAATFEALKTPMLRVLSNLRTGDVRICADRWRLKASMGEAASGPEGTP